jgi:hypothetical protein
MEVIFYYIVFFGGIWLISTIVSKINEAVRKRRERIKSQVADEVLSGLNIDSVIDDYKKKLEHIKYIKPNLIQNTVNQFNQWPSGRDTVLLGKCPDCKEGYLAIRNGKYGKFLACNKYPKCSYTKNITTAREDYKKSINEQFVDDIKKAYSQL